MKKILMASLIALSFSASLQGAPLITFNTVAKGFPPFLMRTVDGDDTGIVWDVFEHILTKLDYQIKTVSLPKKRVVLEMDAGGLDATGGAREWVASPKKYIFSDTLLTVNDVLVLMRDRPLVYRGVDDLFNKSLAVHHGYRYPLLDQYIASGKIQSIVENSEFLMLKSVLYNNADAAVINDWVAKWIIKNNQSMKQHFVFSDKALGSFDYRIMFTKRWQGVLESFNSELAKMKSNGDLQKIINKYK